MAQFTDGSTRLALKQDALARVQANGAAVLDSRRTRPLWFDGRFLAARDLAREQDYFLQRQADLATAAGFGVIHGLWVSAGTGRGPADAETIVIHSGQGVTPSGELVMISEDLAIRLSDLSEEENLDVQFGLSAAPKSPARTRTGLFVVALRPVEFTANPITSYPTSIQGSRTTHDGDIVEATAVSLVPFPDPVNTADGAIRRAALARQIFLNGNPGNLSDSLLPVALISIQRGVIDWVDPYLVRRDCGPEYRGVRFGLTDAATQQAFLLQYDGQLQEVVAARQNAGLSARFGAGDFFQALPPAGRFPLAAISTDDFSQVYFPQQLDVRLSVIPEDELPALIEDSMSLPPIDLTLPADAYSNLAVVALVPVPRTSFAALKQALPEVPLNPTLPQVISFRQPIQLLRLYQGTINLDVIPPASNQAWAQAIGSQKYGFYIRRRITPAFVDFTSASPIVTTTTLAAGPSAITFGASVVLTATVSPPAATGSVQFLDGVKVLGSVTPLGGSASLAVSTLTGGAHSIKAEYSGDGNFSASASQAATVTVSKADPGIRGASSPNPSDAGQAVTFKITVSSSAATGTVDFRDGAELLGTVAVRAKSAAFSTSALSSGSHAVTAAYREDANFNSASIGITQVVNAGATTTGEPTTTLAATTTTARTTTAAPTTTTPRPTTTVPPTTTTAPPTTTTAAPTTTVAPTTTRITTAPPTTTTVRTTIAPGTTRILTTLGPPILAPPLTAVRRPTKPVKRRPK